MKTSILISSFVTLCLLVTFAEAPRHLCEDKMSLTPTENVSIKTIELVTLLPASGITADLKKVANIAIQVTAAMDFSYLNFDVTEYMQADARNPEESEVMPESEPNFSYMKFNVNEYISDSDFNSDKKTELPLTENNAISIHEPASFEYLRFDVNNYIISIETEAAVFGELLSQKVETVNPAIKDVTGKIPMELGYLKFDVTIYYSSSNLGTAEKFELPQK